METKQAAKQAQKNEEKIVRILSKDIEGGMKVYAGLTKVKGVSWGISNATCIKLNIDKNRKIGSLSEGEIKKISEFLKNPEVPLHILNRRNDFESGEDKHLTGSDLELRKEFDIKRLRKIKSYRGLRHSLKLPLRGQRTKGHFRTHRAKSTGVKKKKKVEKQEK